MKEADKTITSHVVLCTPRVLCKGNCQCKAIVSCITYRPINEMPGRHAALLKKKLTIRYMVYCFTYCRYCEEGTKKTVYLNAVMTKGSIIRCRYNIRLRHLSFSAAYKQFINFSIKWLPCCCVAIRPYQPLQIHTNMSHTGGYVILHCPLTHFAKPKCE